MLLSARTVVPYLLQQGALAAEAVVEGDVMVVEVPRRNRNYKVVRLQGHGLFVKQIASWDAVSIATLQREAACYRLAASSAELQQLAALLPRFGFYDPQRHVLVIELLTEGEDLAAYHRRRGQFPEAVAARLGEALGGYHRHGRLPARADGFPRAVPWVLSFPEQAEVAGALSPANRQLLDVLQRHAGFHAALGELRAQWRPICLIHGDMKWDNCLVVPRSADADEVEIKVVDWELADLGDPCWDVGAIFQAYLAFWIFSMPMRQLPPARLLALAEHPLERMQPAIGAFWQAYRRARELDAGAADATLQLSMRYAAARMIQTAYEAMFQQPQLTPAMYLLLQMSLNVLTRPREAAQDLLALQPT